MTIYKSGVAVEIKSGIPIPPNRAAATNLKSVALDMQINDCIDVPYKRAAISSNLSRITGHTYTQRRVGDVLRIWRIK